ncbi:unnamed protein product [Rhizophagus irregularis]|nr:unnamed protein product [Rhizophagus irregularis]
MGKHFINEGVVSDNPDIGDDKIILGLNSKEYLDNWDNNSLITQINFIESTHSTSSHKSSGYAWEKKQTEDSFTQQSSAEIVNSLSMKQKKKRKMPNISFISFTKDSKALSLPDEDDNSQNVISNKQEEETLADNTVDE